MNRRQPWKSQLLQAVTHYGALQDVVGDGNCGYYSLMEGLHLLGIHVPMDVTLLRKEIYNYADKWRKRRADIFPICGKTTDRGYQKQVLNHIWEDEVDYKLGWIIVSQGALTTPSRNVRK